MKKIPAVVLFICINALLIFFQVHKQSQIIKVRRNIQTHQKKIDQLEQKKRELNVQLHRIKQPYKIKQFATDKMNMKPISLKKVKKIHEDA